MFDLLDTFFMKNKTFVGKEERDVIILHHSIGIAWPIGRKEMKHITLVEYGQPDGKTAMARTVGIPAAIATNMLLKGKRVGYNNIHTGILNKFLVDIRVVHFYLYLYLHVIFAGEIQQKGMVLPLTPDIYRPMLSRLRLEGLKAAESSLSF